MPNNYQQKLTSTNYMTKTLMVVILLLFSTISLCLGQPSPDPVYDFDENLLQAGTEYYVLPQGMGGGLTLAARGNESCPLDVVQTNVDTDNGLPLAFIPVDLNTGDYVIWESTDLNIIFSGSSSTACADQSNVWMLDLYDRQLIITGNGVQGNPGLVTLNNWFKITKYEDGYKLAFCPEVCDHCASVCGDIGVVIAQNETRRLGISDVPLKVKFKKALI
uniref:kunitz trypsin inhibitor 5-like n=1 Tax=Erigeron canadensis TaxID=72917 RepID=UPI001CB8F387|nr:kunitz trypsin inhibitor 5-like [Erigeron canadensis]